MRAISRGAESCPFSSTFLHPADSQESKLSISQHFLQPHKQVAFTRFQRTNASSASSTFFGPQGNPQCCARVYSRIVEQHYISQVLRRGSLSGNSSKAPERRKVTRVGSNMGTTTAPIKVRYEEDADMREVLFSADVLAAKVAELGKQISEDFAGKPVVLLGVRRELKLIDAFLQSQELFLVIC